MKTNSPVAYVNNKTLITIRVYYYVEKKYCESVPTVLSVLIFLVISFPLREDNAMLFAPNFFPEFKLERDKLTLLIL